MRITHTTSQIHFKPFIRSSVGVGGRFFYKPQTKNFFNNVREIMQAAQSTERCYYKDTNLGTLDAKIISTGSDKEGNFVVLDKTIFHPQGGGQPSDVGFLLVNGSKVNIIKVLATTKEAQCPINLYYKAEENAEVSLKVDAIISQQVDLEKRTLFARYHSAGHLLSNALEGMGDFQGVGGNHIPGQANVKFKGKLPEKAGQDDLAKNLTEKVNGYIKENLSVKNIWNDDGSRRVQFGELKDYPCGGTHVHQTEIIGEFSVRNFKEDRKEKGVFFQIGYEIKA